MTEEAITISKKIPEGYVLETIFRENGKSFELWHNPKSTDQKTTYIKHEVGSKW